MDEGEYAMNLGRQGPGAWAVPEPEPEPEPVADVVASACDVVSLVEAEELDRREGISSPSKA